jgi:flavin-dependent dehydrogenase
VSRLDHDLLIVGAGPVGSYTALRAAQRGFTVALVEPRPDPIDKACGEGLMPGAIEQLASVGIDPEGAAFDGITYVSADGRRVARAWFSGPPGRGVRRVVLQRLLARRAKECGVLRYDDRATTIRQGSDAAQVSMSGGGTLRARYVVGADGLHSTVRREIGLQPTPPRRPRYGLTQHFHRAPWSQHVEVHWAKDAEAYVTPIADDGVGVAILGTRSAGTFSDRVQQFPHLRGLLGTADRVGPTLGAGPLRQRVRQRVRGRVLLVGDAAGYVDALTGEGLAVGFAAADALVDAIDANDLGAYESEWRGVTRRFRWSTSALVAVSRPRWSRQVLVPLASTMPGLFSATVNKLA